MAEEKTVVKPTAEQLDKINPGVSIEEGEVEGQAHCPCWNCGLNNHFRYGMDWFICRGCYVMNQVHYN